MNTKTRALVAPAASFAAAIAVGALLIAVVGKSPLSVYAELVSGTLGSAYGIGQTIAKATPLVFAGLSVAVAFRAGLFNVGCEGQMMIGGLAAALTGVLCGSWPAPISIPLELLAAAAGGAAVAGIAGWLRARRGVHEVISTIMLNFIAAAAAGAAIARFAVHATVRTEEIAEPGRLPRLAAFAETIGFSSLADSLRPSTANAAALLAIAAVVAVAWLLSRSVTGFEIRVTGENERASQNAGIDVARTRVLAMILSGGLAGLGSASYVLGAKYYYESGFVSGAGFTGIAVALVGRNHPVGIILAALLFGALSQGGLAINSEVSSELVTVLQAVTILFLIGSMAWSRRTPRSPRSRAENPAGRAA